MSLTLEKLNQKTKERAERKELAIRSFFRDIREHRLPMFFKGYVVALFDSLKLDAMTWQYEDFFEPLNGRNGVYVISAKEIEENSDKYKLLINYNDLQCLSGTAGDIEVEFEFKDNKTTVLKSEVKTMMMS